MATSVTAVPLTDLAQLGTVRTAGLQLHTIRQVSTINAPNLTGLDDEGRSFGDLILDSGDVTRVDNGHIRIQGAVEGSSKLSVLETGVWNKNTTVGTLTNSTLEATTLQEHISAGTLITGLKIPNLGGSSLQTDKVYALRNIGTTGHCAWASINDIEGDLAVTGELSVSADTFLTQNVSIGGDTTIVGILSLASTLDVFDGVIARSTLSVSGRSDLDSSLNVTGSVAFGDTLSVNGDTNMASAVSIAGMITGEGQVEFGDTLSVSGFTQLEDHLSVSLDTSLRNLTIRGQLMPFSNGMTVTTGNVIVGDTLSVGSSVITSSTLSVASSSTFQGPNFDVNAASNVNIGTATTAVNILADTCNTAGNFALDGHLSVANTSSVLLSTPVLSISGNTFSEGNVSALGNLSIGSDINCDTGLRVGSTLHVQSSGQVGGAFTVGSHLSVGGTVTINGDLQVEGTSTTINTQNVTVEDTTLELNVRSDASDTNADGAGLFIRGDTNKSITYKRAGTFDTTSDQLSAFSLSDDLVLGEKSTPFVSAEDSKLNVSRRSNAIHLGDTSSTDGHWMIVVDIERQKLQFWFGQALDDASAMDAMPAAQAKLAFEIQKPA